MQLVVGRIGKPHGIHGEVSVEVRTDDPERRFAPGAVVATDPAGNGPLTVVRARAHAGRMLVSFAEAADRTGAEALRGTLLVADSATCPEPADPDEFWDHDLVGLTAVTVDGDPVGAVTEVLHLPGQDALVVHRQEVDAEVIVPFVAAIVPDVDIGGGRVVVDPPPGLLDDNET